MASRMLKASEVNNYIGKKVQIVYAVRETKNTGQLVFVYGHDITPPVELLKFDSTNGTVEVRRNNGSTDTLQPYLILVDE